MAEATISVVMERVMAITKKQTRYGVNLVGGIEKEVLISVYNVLKKIKSVLYDAERIRFKEKAVDDWLSKLEQICHEIEGILDDWNDAILKVKREHESNDVSAAPCKQKVCYFTRSPCLFFRKLGVRRSLAKKIGNVKAQLDLISVEKDWYNIVLSEPTAIHTRQVQSTSSIHQEGVYGRDGDKEYLLDKLMASGVSPLGLGLQVLSIVGMGGIGKTTLAQLVYNDRRVKECFELRIWVHVSDPFDEVVIANRIIESVEKVNTFHLDFVYEQLRGCISGKKFLLVLDDVWTYEYNNWEPLITSLECGGAGSKVLVTTRNERVARLMSTMQTYRLPVVSHDDWWLILRDTVLLGSNVVDEFIKFEGMGKKIAEKCTGLPYAAKTLGSLLRYNYKSSLEDWEWESVFNQEILKLEHSTLFTPLFLSYNELSPILKHCFSYCAIFSQDSSIEVEKLIENWIALGYLGSGSKLELRGRDYFDILANQSLFQGFERTLDGQIKTCKIYGIVHDFARFLRMRRNVGAKKTTCHVCDDLSVVLNVEVYRSLFWDYKYPLTICGCLRSLRVLRIRSKLPSIPQDVENLINLRLLELSGNKLSREDTRIICKLYKLQFLRFCAQEVPWEIGNLVHLRLLDLSYSDSLRELPESICGLIELRTLNIKFCRRLSKLPQGIHKLINLKHLPNLGTSCLKQFPEGIKQIVDLRTLSEYCGGSGWSKLEWLNKLHQLSGFLSLRIRLVGAKVVEDALEAELISKTRIEELQIIFEDEMDQEDQLQISHFDALNVLTPHRKLQKLHIWFYNGFELPGSITSPLRTLTSIKLYSFNRMSSLPALGQLPCLENIYLSEMHGLRFVRRRFLGITTTTRRDMYFESSSSSSSVSVGFPKLKELTFNHCPGLMGWEDITAEEEESAAVLLMPRLKKLTIIGSPRLNALPHRLLRKASSLQELNILSCSTELQQSYRILGGSSWKFTSQDNPHAIASTSQVFQT